MLSTYVKLIAHTKTRKSKLWDNLGCEIGKLFCTPAYEIGDTLLLAIRDRVTACLGTNDILAHLEEDNFCILQHTETRLQVERLRDIIFDSFTHPFRKSVSSIKTTA